MPQTDNQNNVKLRPAQETILAYRHGRMAVSAVPGSGKTFTLAHLAANLLQESYAAEKNRLLDPHTDQQILIVTYLNASVDTFRARIRKRLEALKLPPDNGYDVRTLHSIALEIVRVAESGLGDGSNEPFVLDEIQSNLFLSQAIDDWVAKNPDIWFAFLADDSPRMRVRWRNITESTARSFIQMAKNERYRAVDILGQLSPVELGNNGQLADAQAVVRSPLLHMMAGIYNRYQILLNYQGAFDFDDLIWLATDLLRSRPELVLELRSRWPVVLEDEAQDSVPLQEILLSTLTGPGGNWVRVGDPNQAITSSFTAADPQFFNAFIDQEDVEFRPLPNSGRSAPIIMGAANKIVDWVIDEHPVPEVQQNTFRRQYIYPTPEGDGQPNPPDEEASIQIKVYKHREDEEIPTVANTAVQHATARPQHTLAILVPTHQTGHLVAEILDELGAPYDNLLRGGSREREIAAALHAILSILANPLDTKALVAAHASLFQMEHPAVPGTEEGLPRIHTLLRSTHRPEALIFPWDDDDVVNALPSGVATEAEIEQIESFSNFIKNLFSLRSMPIDDLSLALGDELFAHDTVQEADLAIAYQIATVLRSWRELHPDWRLPDLVAELNNVATGRRRLPLSRPSDYGFEPEPGRITLATQHGAKGLEWDTVFLTGIDGFWIPSDLQAPFLGEYDFLGGDPVAEVKAQLYYLMQGDSGLYSGRTATESAHIDIISERLRLLYVGITRARRTLLLSRSRATRRYNKEREAVPATVLGALFSYLKTYRE